MKVSQVMFFCFFVFFFMHVHNNFPIFVSAHNTMYLEVHCPAVRPHVVVVSDCGRTVVDFENVSLGKISC